MVAPRIGPRALHCVKSFEGVKLRAYLCPANVWTIGYGSTGPHVKPGLTISLAEAEKLLRDDLSRFEVGVHRAVNGNATPAEYGALVSLAFNIGLGAFNRSSVLRHHKAGNKPGAEASFLLWNKAGGRVLPGLTRRRNAEAALYRNDLGTFDRLTGFA
jgi:lysozyme